MRINKKAYAKINLHLSVGNKRHDGYHEICTLMKTITLHDLLSVAIEENGQSDGKIVIFCDNPSIPVNEKNIVHKACNAFFNAVGIDLKNYDITIGIEKNIPEKAGLGGGSTDGAAVILALAEFFNVTDESSLLLKAAAKTGADLPFFVALRGEGAAVCRGIGEIVTPVEFYTGNLFISLIKPCFGIDTSCAYREIDKNNTGTGIVDIFSVLENKSTDESFLCFKNDFLQVAEAQNSITGEILTSMRNFSPLYSGLSGSGSALFAVFDDENKADLCSKILREQYDSEFCSTVRFT